MRKRISPELKGKVVIAAIQRHRTVNEIVKQVVKDKGTTIKFALDDKKKI